LNDERPSLGAFYVIGAAVLWGTTGTSQALAPAGATPFAVGALRILIGGLALLALARVRHAGGSLRRWPPLLTLFAGLTTALYQITFFGGVARTGVAVGTMVAIGSVPIWTGILGAVFEGERPSVRWLAATVIAIIGCVLLVYSGGANVAIDLLGVALSLGAGLSYAAFTTANKRLLVTHTSDAAMAASFCIGALLLFPFLLTTDTTWVWTVGGSVVVLHLGLIATGLSYALFGRGLRTVPVSVVGTLTLAEPLTAAALGLLLLREHIPTLGIFGMVLIFGGLALLAVRPRRAVAG
jgi:DME family drug/metabolite transporter